MGGILFTYLEHETILEDPSRVTMRCIVNDVDAGVSITEDQVGRDDEISRRLLFGQMA